MKNIVKSGMKSGVQRFQMLPEPASPVCSSKKEAPLLHTWDIAQSSPTQTGQLVAMILHFAQEDSSVTLL